MIKSDFFSIFDCSSSGGFVETCRAYEFQIKIPDEEKKVYFSSRNGFLHHQIEFPWAKY